MTLDAEEWLSAGAIMIFMHVTLVVVAVRQLLRYVPGPRSRLAWLTLILLAPVFGTLSWFRFAASRQAERKPLAS